MLKENFVMIKIIQVWCKQLDLAIEATECVAKWITTENIAVQPMQITIAASLQKVQILRQSITPYKALEI